MTFTYTRATRIQNEKKGEGGARGGCARTIPERTFHPHVRIHDALLTITTYHSNNYENTHIIRIQFNAINLITLMIKYLVLIQINC